MNKKKVELSIQQQELWKKAEGKLAAAKSAMKEAINPDPEKVLYELHVHQIELELQNEELRQAQVALETSRAHYIDLYDCAPVGYLTLTLEGNIAEINLTGAKLLGIDRKLLRNRRFAQFIADSHKDLWHRHFIQVKGTGQSVTCEFPFLLENDVTVYLHLTCVLNIDGGVPHSIRLSFQDVTELKRIEEELKVQEQLSKIALSTPGVFWSFRLAPNGLMGIPYASQGFESLYGFNPNLYAEDWNPLIARIHHDDLGAFQNAIHESAQDLQPWKVIFRYLHPDKGESWLEGQSIAHVEKDGSVLWHGYIQDITERKIAEQTQLETEQRVHLATVTTGVGIWEWDIVSDLIKWDDQMFRLYGVAPTPNGLVEYSTWSGLVLPEDLPQQEAMLQDSIRNPVKSKREFRIRRANDGEIRYIQAVETTRSTIQGKTKWVVGTNFDVTEDKNASDIIKATLKEKEVLLKEIYHRVKNNLQVVSSLINLQARSVVNDEALGLLKQSADRIKAMALVHERLYQSNDLAKIDFNHYIGNLADSLLYSFGFPIGHIKIALDIHDIFLDIDRAIPCGLIVNELISNALKHAFPNGQPGNIDISFTHDNNEYKLVVSDNGVGLPNGMDIKTCLSLGLQLVSGLVVNQLNGKISIDPNNVASFIIHFPMDDHLSNEV
jgi:PAS domain S-box-containing protein